MRFTARQDYDTILKINKELINTVIDTPVIVYKIQIVNTKTNIYGEAVDKTYYTGVIVPCLIDRQELESVDNEDGLPDFDQEVTFAFLRDELSDRNVYPETGDIIEYDSQYYEVNTSVEVQQYAGQVEYNHQVLCKSHLMRTVPLQLERPKV